MSAPRGSPTDGKQQSTVDTMAQAVHAALAGKLAYAIRYSPCILMWLLSGTIPETMAHPATTQFNQMQKYGGIASSEVTFKP